MCGCCEPLPKEHREEQVKTERVRIKEIQIEDDRKPEKEPVGVR